MELKVYKAIFIFFLDGWIILDGIESYIIYDTKVRVWAEIILDGIERLYVT